MSKIPQRKLSQLGQYMLCKGTNATRTSPGSKQNLSGTYGQWKQCRVFCDSSSTSSMFCVFFNFQHSKYLQMILSNGGGVCSIPDPHFCWYKMKQPPCCLRYRSWGTVAQLLWAKLVMMMGIASRNGWSLKRQFLQKGCIAILYGNTAVEIGWKMNGYMCIFGYIWLVWRDTHVIKIHF